MTSSPGTQERQAGPRFDVVWRRTPQGSLGPDTRDENSEPGSWAPFVTYPQKA